MKTKIFNWSKSRKTPSSMQDELNDFLKNNLLFDVVQNESPKTGRVTVTILYDEKASKDKRGKDCVSSVIRTQGHNQLQTDLNERLKSINKIYKMCQSFGGNTITTIFFHGK